MSDSQPEQDASSSSQNAKAAIRAAEQAWRSQSAEQLNAALAGCDRALQALPPEQTLDTEDGKAPDPADPLARERASLWLWRGRILTMADQPDAIVQGLRSLDQAIGRLKSHSTPDAGDAAAIAWMNRGNGLMRLGASHALADAVRSFDQAIEAMENSASASSNALGVCWMNRGLGLLHMEANGEPRESIQARRLEAVRSLERAVSVLEPLMATQPVALGNLATAWTNLSLARTQCGDASGALAAQLKAVEVFRPIAAQGGAGEKFELAVRLYNLGQAAGNAGDAALSLASGRESLALAESLELPQAIELILRARHGLCVNLGAMLAADSTPSAERSAQLEEAGDLVEDGLAALAKRGADATPGEKLAGVRLYEFGGWFYRTQQPRFLGEFLLEHLGEDPARAEVASAAIKAAREAFLQRNFANSSHSSMDRVLDVLQELGVIEARLKERGLTV